MLYLVNTLAGSLVGLYGLRGVQALFLPAVFLLSAGIYRHVEAPFLVLRSRLALCRETVAAQNLDAAQAGARRASLRWSLETPRS